LQDSSTLHCKAFPVGLLPVAGVLLSHLATGLTIKCDSYAASYDVPQAHALHMVGC